MKKIFLVIFFFASIASYGQLTKTQLGNINARDIKSSGAYSSLKTGKLNDSTYLSLLGVRNNLSDLNSASTARTNLGLGSLAILNTINNFNWSGTPLSAGNGGTGLTSLGTGVATALGINIGSAGAFTTFNGAGGTPSSLTLTNATGLPPTTGIVGWPSNSAGVLTNNGSGTLSWGSAGTSYTADESTLHLTGTVFSILSTAVLPSTVTATTQPQGTNNGTVATTGYVDRLTLTISTGLTNTSGTLTADLSTGKSGGQSIIGGTASGNSLTLSSTSNATKGSIIFGASSYSEANNTIALVLNTQGSTMGGTWTATANNQDHIIMSPSITGRTAAAGGNADAYNVFHLGGTGTLGASANAQIFRMFYGDMTIGVGSGKREVFTSNPTWSTPTSTDYLLHLMSASTDRFQVDYSGNVTGAGATLLNTYSTSTIFGTPVFRAQSAGTTAELWVYNTAGGGLPYKFKSDNTGVFKFNDNTNDIYTVSSSAWAFNRAISHTYVAKTANYTLDASNTIVNCTSNSFTITLPTAVGIAGRYYIIYNTGSGTITLATTSSQTIDFNAPGTLIAGNVTPQKIKLYSDGANWLTF